MWVLLDYHRSGAGAPLLLLHSTAADWRTWKPVLPYLQPGYDVIAVDLPGFGGSAPVAGAVTVGALADAIQAFLAETGTSSPHVAGMSLGGWIALELARRNSVRSVTAFSPSGLWPTRAPRQTLWLLRLLQASARVPEPLLRVLATRPTGRTVAAGAFVGRPWQLSADDLLAMRHAALDCPGFPGVYALHKNEAFDGRAITVPVTVAYGSRDHIVPHRARHRDVLPSHALWLSLPGCGHIPTWDDPAGVAALIDTTARSAN